jgi:hypothetical protein
MCESGCGVTSAAMVLSQMGMAVTPTDVADFVVVSGLRDDLTPTPGATCTGVNHLGLCRIAAWKGLRCEETHSFDDLRSWLSEGPVIANVESHRNTSSWNRCKFTTGGHYIVIFDFAAGIYNVSDVGSCSSSRSWATEHDLSIDCFNAGFVRFIEDGSNSREIVLEI